MSSTIVGVVTELENAQSIAHNVYEKHLSKRNACFEAYGELHDANMSLQLWKSLSFSLLV